MTGPTTGCGWPDRIKKSSITSIVLGVLVQVPICFEEKSEKQRKNETRREGSEGNHTGERRRDECHVNVPRALTSQ